MSNLNLAIPFFIKKAPSGPILLTSFRIECAQVFDNNFWFGWMNARSEGRLITAAGVTVSALPTYTARSGATRTVNGIAYIGDVRLSVNSGTPQDDMPDRIRVVDIDATSVTETLMETTNSFANRGLGAQYDYDIIDGSSQLTSLFSINNRLLIELYQVG